MFNPITMLITGLAIIIAATLLWVWLFMRVYPRRFGLEGTPFHLIFWALALGVMALVVAMFLEIVGIPILFGAEDALIRGEHTLFVVLMVGMVVLLSPVEEFCKYLMFRMSLTNRRQFWGVHRGAIVGAAVGLGFACVENLGYMLTSGMLDPDSAVYSAAYRSIIGFPIHALLGMLMGGLLGKWKAGGGTDTRLAVRAFLLPAGVHVAYNVVAISPIIFISPSEMVGYGMEDIFYAGSEDLFTELVFLGILAALVLTLFLLIDRRLRSEKLIPAQGSVESIHESGNSGEQP